MDSTTPPPPRTLTVPEAAEQLGITEKAVRRRIERGTLPSVLGHDGKRRIPVQAVDTQHASDPAGDPLLGELVERLEHQASELGRLRALTDGSERRERELVDELHRERADRQAAEARETEARERAAAAEAEARILAEQVRRRRWFGRNRQRDGEQVELAAGPMPRRLAHP